MRDYLYSIATDKRKGLSASFVKAVLLLLSYLYGCVLVCVRGCRCLFKRKVRGLVVISVGNITVGGTGKTPLVELICRFLLEQKRSVAVLSRGYARFASVGDEPRMLMGRLSGLKVLVDSHRIRAARAALKSGRDTVVLDDGFQQWGVAKDLDIVVVDSANPFGNGCLLPRGILREPLSALARATVIVVTKTNLYPPSVDLLAKLTLLNPRALIVEAAHEPVDLYETSDERRRLPIEFLRGRKVALFCAIGDPASFEDLVRACGGIIELSTRFRDHHAYSAADMESLFGRSAEKNIYTVITTEKDAARLDGIIPSTCRVLVLRMRMALVKNDRQFFDRLLKLYPV